MTASSIMTSYAVGKAEAEAACELLRAPLCVYKKLEECVKTFGCVNLFSFPDALPRTHTMGKFVTHEAIASGYFKPDGCCASSTQAAWTQELTISVEALMLLLARMEKDWLRTPTKLRKPWSGRDVEPCRRPLVRLMLLSEETLLKSCCAFLACCRVFERGYPSDFTTSQLEGIRKSWLAIYGTTFSGRSSRLRFWSEAKLF